MEPSAAQIADLLARTNRTLRRRASAELGRIGITPSQGRMLRVLARAGEPIRISELARRLDVVPRSATSVVDDLEAAGLVRRGSDPADRRATLVDLTGAGAAVMAELRAQRRAGAAELLDRLTPREQADLIRLLSVLAE